MLGAIYRPLGETRSIGGNLVASMLMVGAWGYFLIQGVLDPLGGINSLWPLFGIANQMLAAIALCLGTTLILKVALREANGFRRPRTALALITFIPLIWLLAVTMTAGVQKIAHSDPRIGFLAQARVLAEKRPEIDRQLDAARKSGKTEAIQAAGKAVRENRATRFNQLLDAVIAAIFLALISGIVVLSVREWILLLSRRKPAVLAETPPTYLPDYAVVESRPVRVGTAVALGVALARELSGEAQAARAQEQAATWVCSADGRDERSIQRRAYLEVAEKRFKGINRCC